MSRAAASLLALFLLLTPFARADIVYLKNGRSMSGVIRSQDAASVILDVGFGTVELQASQIEKIHKSSPEEKAKLHRQWEEQRLAAELENQRREAQRSEDELQESRRREARRREDELKAAQQREPQPKKEQVSFIAGQPLCLNVLLNKKVKTKLLLDTGATLVVVSEKVGRQLGIDKEKARDTIDLIMADGRKIKALFTQLDSVSVGDNEEKKVEAAIFLDEIADQGSIEGVLGMSYLSRFKFEIDTKNDQLILKK